MFLRDIDNGAGSIRKLAADGRPGAPELEPQVGSIAVDAVGQLYCLPTNLPMLGEKS